MIYVIIIVAIIALVLFIVGLFKSIFNAIVAILLSIAIGIVVFAILDINSFEKVENAFWIYAIPGAVYGVIRGLPLCFSINEEVTDYFFATYIVEFTEEHRSFNIITSLVTGAIFGCITGFGCGVATFYDKIWISWVCVIGIGIYSIGCLIKAIVNH